MVTQVKKGFRNLSIPDKLQKTGKIMASITGNPAYPSPMPTLAEVGAKVAALETAYQAALDGGKALKAAIQQREVELDDTMSQLVAYVQSASGGDAEKIRSSGFDVKLAPTNSAADVERPVNLQAFTSNRAGEVTLDWDSVKGAKSYTVEKSSDGFNGWAGCGNSTRSELVVQNLPSMANTYFRVAAIGSAGQKCLERTAKGLVS